MSGVWRRHLVALLCIALAGIVAIAAIVDHRVKQARMNRAEFAEWYCEHRGTHCGGPSSAGIERHWNERQTAYEVAVSVLAAAGIASGALAAARRGRG